MYLFLWACFHKKSIWYTVMLFILMLFSPLFKRIQDRKHSKCNYWRITAWLHAWSANVVNFTVVQTKHISYASHSWASNWGCWFRSLLIMMYNWGLYFFCNTHLEPTISGIILSMFHGENLDFLLFLSLCFLSVANFAVIVIGEWRNQIPAFSNESLSLISFCSKQDCIEK